MVKNFSIKNNKLCKTNPISEKQKMNLSSYTTKTYGNKSRLLTMAKQTQSNPICSELACPEQVPISRDASKGSNLPVVSLSNPPVVSLSNLFYRHSVWRKFIKNLSRSMPKLNFLKPLPSACNLWLILNITNYGTKT